MQRLFVSLAVVFLGCLAVPATLNAYDAADYLKSGDAWREGRVRRRRWPSTTRPCAGSRQRRRHV